MFGGNLFADSLIPIDSKRGTFFQDDFFENSRRHFQQAVDQVLRRTSSIDTRPAASDPLQWYHSHRLSDTADDMRAGTITTEDKNYKVRKYFVFWYN